MIVVCLIGHFFIGDPMFSTNCKAPVYGGDSACPPELPLRFAIVSYYLFWSYRFKEGATALGRRHFMPVATKSVKKNILRISHVN